MYKNVTVEFLGCDAEFFIYATITKRKRRVQQGREIEESYDKQITDKYKKTLLEKETWYGPEKIYTDD